jgi:predicted transcriptional regulator
MSARRKRGTISITESILEAVKEGEALKTHIAYKSKIDSRTIEKYIRFLVGVNMIKKNPTGEYKITKKGLDFLRKYSELKAYGVMDDNL